MANQVPEGFGIGERCSLVPQFLGPTFTQMFQSGLVGQSRDWRLDILGDSYNEHLQTILPSGACRRHRDALSDTGQVIANSSGVLGLGDCHDAIVVVDSSQREDAVSRLGRSRPFL